jgi:hypothetical protein
LIVAKDENSNISGRSHQQLRFLKIPLFTYWSAYLSDDLRLQKKVDNYTRARETRVFLRVGRHADHKSKMYPRRHDAGDTNSICWLMMQCAII